MGTLKSNISSQINTELLPSQKEGILFALKTPYSAVLLKMGYGKTLIGIGLSLHDSVKKTIVVCPAFLKLNWEYEYKKYCVKDPRVEVLESKTVPSEWSGAADVYIINYEMLKHTEHLFSEADLVIADEAHYLGNMKAQRTEMFVHYMYRYKPRRFLALSATIISGKIPQVYPLLVITAIKSRKKITDTFKSAFTFSTFFCKTKQINIGTRTITQFYGTQNIPILRTYLDEVTFRKPKVLNPIIPFVTKEIIVKGKSKNRLLEKAFESFNRGTPISEEHISSAKLQNALDKTSTTAKYAQELHEDTGKSIVIFSDHPSALDKISEKLKGSFDIIHGGIPTDKRDPIVRRFQNGELNFLLLTIGAGGVGINLTYSNLLVFNDISWVGEKNSQAAARVIRYGQVETCVISYINKGKVDVQINKICREKSKVNKEFYGE